MGRLIESTILQTLTSGLKVVATSPLHIYKDDEGNIIWKFGETCPTTQHAATTIPHVNLYIAGDLVFQAMARGKESMMEAQLSEVKIWTVEVYCRLGEEAERRGTSKTKLGAK
jgi:hypothetical protein